MSYKWEDASTKQGMERLKELGETEVVYIVQAYGISAVYIDSARLILAELEKSGIHGFLDPSQLPEPVADENGLPKLKWEQTFKANPWDGVSVCATYMGLDFHVELKDDGRFEMSAMVHGALYGFGKVAIRQRAINRMDKIFNEMLQSPIDVMRIAERYAKD